MLKSKIKPIEGACSAKETFGLMVVGDSMLPEFKNATVLVVDPEAVARDGSFVVAEINQEYVLKQLLIEDGRFYLNTLNKAFNEPILEIKGVEQIVGVVIQQGSRRNNLKKYR